ncbi:hypothetical protein RUM44_002196 [Polyplax serrata]|uniref:Uncharacterized protein n=2 Tax=Polyplax serrata TaxID=468196 RepID=A0ABR1AM74_POLSC
MEQYAKRDEKKNLEEACGVCETLTWGAEVWNSQLLEIKKKTLEKQNPAKLALKITKWLSSSLLNFVQTVSIIGPSARATAAGLFEVYHQLVDWDEDVIMKEGKASFINPLFPTGRQSFVKFKLLIKSFVFS